jgi:hypothetical protein
MQLRNGFGKEEKQLFRNPETSAHSLHLRSEQIWETGKTTLNVAPSMDGGLVLSPVSAEPCSKPLSTRLLTSLTSRLGVFAVGKATNPIAHLARAAAAGTGRTLLRG